MVTVNAEVVGVIETSPVPGVYNPVAPDLFGDGGRILAKVLCYFAEGLSLIEASLDVDSVFQG